MIKTSYYLVLSAVSFCCLYPQVPTAVIDFEGKGISQTEASALTDRLRGELFKIGFQVMERGLMEEILTEQGFQQTGFTSEKVDELHKTIDRENAIYPVAFGIGVACALPAIYQYWKKENLETKLSQEQD